MTMHRRTNEGTMYGYNSPLKLCWYNNESHRSVVVDIPAIELALGGGGAPQGEMGGRTCSHLEFFSRSERSRKPPPPIFAFPYFSPPSKVPDSSYT